MMVSTRQLRSVAAHGENTSQTSPMELLLHVTLALLPILAIAVVTLNTIQTNLRRGVEGNLHEAILEVQLQRLIARYERLLDEHERWLLLDVFPTEDPQDNSLLPEVFAIGDDGFPKDPRFRRFCARADQLLSKHDTDDLVRIILDEAIHLPESVETGGNYTRNADVWSAVYALDQKDGDRRVLRVTDKHRKYALQHIRQRVTTWSPRVEAIQLAALVAALDAKKIEKVVEAPDVDGIRENILEEFKSRGIPLRPGAVRKSRGEE